jgi:1-acyl-sn-glycerol-3-phosphate acyltransferase
MIQPNREQLACLDPLERFWFRVTDFVLRYLRPVSILWNRIFMVHFSFLMTGPRVHRFGLENLEGLTPTDRIVVVSNHRSFFDFYVIGPILYTESNLSKHILFPVRSTFFFDSIFGGILNGIMSGFFMFPPVMRKSSKRIFNSYALERMTAEMERPGQQLGIHPEGTRGQSDNPYELLRPQPGVGAILVRSPQARVLPVFITGISNSMAAEFKRTWFGPRKAYPIEVFFGPVVSFDDIREKGDRVAVHMEAAQRSMSAVAELAEQHRAIFCPDSEPKQRNHKS